MQPVETPGGPAPLERGEMPRRRGNSPEAPLSGFFGGREVKSVRGAGKRDASSRARRKEARKVEDP
jgi:hypothetical protein